jgi:hypothetical protein
MTISSDCSCNFFDYRFAIAEITLRHPEACSEPEAGAHRRAKPLCDQRQRNTGTIARGGLGIAQVRLAISSQASSITSPQPIGAIELKTTTCSPSAAWK